LKQQAKEDAELELETNKKGLKDFFRKSVVSMCQQNFNQKLSLDAGLSGADRQAAYDQAKIKMLGNIKFIGDLYKKNLLHESIIHAIITQLLDPQKRPKNPSEESNLEMYNELEGCCELLKTVGKEIDSEKAKDWINQYFKYLQHFYLKRGPPRIRFMIQDIIEVRKNGWQLRREFETVKTKEEIRQQYVEEQNEKSRPKRKDGYGHHDRHHHGHHGHHGHQHDRRYSNNQQQDVRQNVKRTAIIRQSSSSARSGNAWGKPSGGAQKQRTPPEMRRSSSNNNNNNRGSQDIRGSKFNSVRRTSSNQSFNNTNNSNNPKTPPSKNPDFIKKEWKELTNTNDKQLPDEELDIFLRKHKEPNGAANVAYGLFFGYYHSAHRVTQNQMRITIRSHIQKKSLNIGQTRNVLQTFAKKLEPWGENNDVPKTGEYYGKMIAELIPNIITIDEALNNFFPANENKPLDNDDIGNKYLLGLMDSLIFLDREQVVEQNHTLFANSFNLAPMSYGSPARRTAIPNPNDKVLGDNEEQQKLLGHLIAILGDDYYSRIQLAPPRQRK